MKREFLKSLELADEVIDKIMAENGKDIETTKGKYADYDAVKEQLKAANEQIEEFRGMDIDGVKAAAEEWKTKAAQAEAEAKAKIQQIQYDHALESALLGNKAKSVKAVKALLDLEKIKYEDGKLSGLDEQVASLKDSQSYLFEGTEPTPPGYEYKPAGGSPPGSQPPKSLAEAVQIGIAAAAGAKK